MDPRTLARLRHAVDSGRLAIGTCRVCGRIILANKPIYLCGTCPPLPDPIEVDLIREQARARSQQWILSGHSLQDL